MTPIDAVAVPAASVSQPDIVKTYTLIGDSDPALSPTAAISDADASRFLAQASMGADRAEIGRVKGLGYEAWLEQQFAMSQTASRWSWLLAHGFAAAEYQTTAAGFDAACWNKLLSSPDTLRQRVALTLSEILVVGIDGLSGGWKAFAAAYYYDLLEDHAFGNYRQLLEAVTLSPAMGGWLTYRGNAKANPRTGALPDENYAREIMQLFTIGLVRLNPDGSAVLSGGRPVPTYDQDDIMGLARVWTGWNWDLGGLTGAAALASPDYQGRPMRQVKAQHETGEKNFLGTWIPAGTDGVTSMHLALDALFNHPNVGPFVGKQLIQRLVTSNPSPGYVARVAAAFDRDESGRRGSLRAVLKAILLDDEARNPANITQATFGKLREPMLRFCQWARACRAASAGGTWTIGNTSDPAKRLGQSPLRSPTVFNFFRPGYVPSGGALGSAGLPAPEFQITNETSVIGYINFMQQVISAGIGDVAGDYSALTGLAGDAPALLSELNTVLAASQISASQLRLMADAVAAMPANSPAALTRRVHAALLLVMSSPQYIVQK